MLQDAAARAASTTALLGVVDSMDEVLEGAEFIKG